MIPPMQAEVSLAVQLDGTVHLSLRLDSLDADSSLSSALSSKCRRSWQSGRDPAVLTSLPSFSSLLPLTLVEQGKALSPSHPLLLKSLISTLTRLLPFTSAEPSLPSDTLLPSGEYKLSTSSSLTHSGYYDCGSLTLPATAAYAATHSLPSVIYSGDIDANTLCGAGEIKWPGTDAEYEGDVESGRRHGQGKLSLPQIGAAYTGSFQHGLRHGHGKLTYDKHSRQYYVGGWRSGERHGQGVMRYSSGNMYDGEWQRNHKHGSGTMHWHTDHLTYTGQWQHDKPTGQGAYKYTTSRRLTPHHPLYNTYRGQVSAGEREGSGSFLYADGGEWHGQWAGGKKEGPGVWVLVNGSEMTGVWKDDELQGEEARRQWAERDIQHLDLQLADMLPADDAQYEWQRVHASLERYDSVMRAVYKQFASVDPSQQWKGKEGFGVRLNLQQLWLCLQHFDLLDPTNAAQVLDLSVSEEKGEKRRVRRADVDRLLFHRYAVSATVPRRRAIEWDSIHDSRHALLYREFAEVLVRLSPLVYPSLASLSSAVGQLLSSIAAQGGHTLPATLFSQNAALQALLREHAATLSSLFKSIAAPTALSLAETSRFTDLTTTSTDLLALLTSPQFASSAFFSDHHTASHLLRLLPSDVCVELVESEVCDGLLRVAVYRYQVDGEKERLRKGRFAVRLEKERQRENDKQRQHDEEEAEIKRLADEQQALLAAEAEAAKDKGGKGKAGAKPTAAAVAAAKRPTSKQQPKAKPGKKSGKDEPEEKTPEELAAETKEEEARRAEVSELLELLVEGVEEEEAEQQAVYPLCWADRPSGEVEQELGAERMAQLLRFVSDLFSSLQRQRCGECTYN